MADENKDLCPVEESDAPYCNHEDCFNRWNQYQINLAANHMPTNECPDQECALCAIRDCPYHSAEHYWHDGCYVCRAAEHDGIAVPVIFADVNPNEEVKAEEKQQEQNGA